MTDLAWESLSNQAVAAAGVVYFLALLAHLVEYAALRKVPVVEAASARSSSVGAATVGSAEQSSGGVALATGPGPGVVPPEVQADAERAGLFARIGLLLTVVAAAIHVLATFARGMAADPNRVPWSNMYEFTLSGTMVVSVLYLALHRRYGLAWMAPIVVGFVVSTLMVAVIWLYDGVVPLPDALNSYWLVIHVVSAVVATAAFTLGGIAAALYLVKERRGAASMTGYLARVPSLPALDRLTYRLHAFAFPVWTFAVLITGPIWAHEAWSRYWAWDPKEVWAFITWVVYAGYLHARATAGWKGRRAAVLALVGVATLWFNFIGINYFADSLHSYAG